MKFSVGILAVVGLGFTDALAEDAGVAFFRKPVDADELLAALGGAAPCDTRFDRRDQ